MNLNFTGSHGREAKTGVMSNHKVTKINVITVSIIVLNGDGRQPIRVQLQKRRLYQK